MREGICVNSILAAAIGGAVGGGVGAALATLLSRMFPEKWRRGVITAVTAVLAIVCSRFAVAYVEHEASAPATIEAQLLSDPDAGAFTRAWREADPSSFQAFVSRVSQGARAGADRNAIV